MTARSWFQALMLRAALHLSARRLLLGFELANLSESNADDALFGRVGEVLVLVETTEPKLMRRMLRSFHRILVAPSGGAAGSYWGFLDACALSARHLLADPLPSVAMTLVHEATHARIERAGIRYEGKCRERIEAICLREEIDFGKRLPGAEALVAEAESALKNNWWDPSKQRDRENGQLRSLGIPEWLLRVRRSL